MVQKGSQRMYRLSSIITMLIGFMLLGAADLQAWPWGKTTLVTINHEAFTTEDYRHWWKHWKEKETPFPDSLEPFIEWHLLVQEAESMELYQEPAYRHKVDTFIKVRALMMLKNEAVDSKIKITDKDLWNRYEQQYSPQWHVRIMYFNEEAKARQFYEEMNSGRLVLADMAKQAMTERGVVNEHEPWLRPNKIPDSWADILAGLTIGEVTQPLERNQGFVLLCLQEQKGPEKSDFESVESDIRKKIRDEQQAELTKELVRRLREKYQVKVDEKLFNSLDVENIPKDFLDRPLVTTNHRDVSVKFFMEQFRKERSMRGALRFQKKDPWDFLKKNVLDRIIFQNLTTWESLDRHYEKSPPFKGTYEFYCGHRLIKELERRLFSPKTEFSDEEVTEYYNQHPEKFTGLEIVTIVTLEADKKLADKIWAEIKQGENFSSVVRKYYSRDIPAKSIPVDHLDSDMKKVVEKLAKGEVSAPFEVKGHSSMVKLMDRKVSSTKPLSEVQEEIVELLREEEPARLRKNYVEQLLARSDIEINEKAWKKLKKEYGGEK